MRCDECKHWKQGGDDYYEWTEKWTGQGQCLAVRENWRVREEAVAGKSRSDFIDEGDWETWSDEPPPAGSYTALQLEALKAAKATVQDGSDYHAELITAPDFYCALFAIADTHPKGQDAVERLGS